MAEENNGGQGAGAGAGQGQGGGQGAGNGAGAGEVKPVVNADGTVTIGDKVFISKESHDIVSEKYRESKSKLDKFETDAQKAEEDRLKAQGEFEKLAETEKAKREQLEQSVNRERRVNALKLAAVQAGTVDAEAVAALANLDSITVSEDGNVDAASVKTVVDTLKKEKAYLFGTHGQGQQTTVKPNIGSNGGGAPGAGAGEGTGEGKTFYRSQLRDSKFYQANRDAILEANRAGRIINDL